MPVVQAVNIELIDLGTHPLAIGGVKAYETAAEEAMLEVPVQWGSNARVCVSVRVGFAGLYMNIPIEVKDIQVCHKLTFTTMLRSRACDSASSLCHAMSYCNGCKA